MSASSTSFRSSALSSSSGLARPPVSRWIASGDTVPEFERQVFRLKPGLAGLTVESRYGHHVVMLDEFRPGAALSFDASRARIAAYLETQVKQNALHQYLNILAERHGVRGLDLFEAA